MEEFLRGIHAKYYTGTDDDMPDHFDDWISGLDIDQWITFAEEYATKKEKEFVSKIHNDRDHDSCECDNCRRWYKFYKNFQS